MLATTKPTEPDNVLRSFGPNGHYLVSAGLDRTCRVWNLRSEGDVRIHAGTAAMTADISAYLFDPRQNYVSVGMQQGRVITESAK